MKNRFIRLLTMIMVLCFILPSCGNQEQPTTNTTEAVSDVLELLTANSQWTIVRGEYCDEDITKAAVSLKKAINEKYSSIAQISLVTDFSMDNKKNETVDVTGFEILVGETTRKQSRDTLEQLQKNHYVIKTIDDKIVIIGENPEATKLAVEYFIENYVNTSATDKLVVPKYISFEGVRELLRPDLAEGATLRYLSWNLGCGAGEPADVLTVLNRFMPDILGMQEINNKTHTSVFTEFLKQHPNYKYAKRNLDNGDNNYTPIIYNSDVLTLVSAGGQYLRSRYTGTGTKSFAYAVFEYEGQRFAVLNFHGAVCSGNYTGYESMSSTERSTIAQNWRKDNATELVEFKAKLIAKYGEMPIMLSGDCNFNNSSEPFAILRNAGFFDAELTAKTIVKTGYNTGFSNHVLPSKGGKAIDHIMQYGGAYFSLFDIIRDDPVATASDHCPVYADFNPFPTV